MFDEAFFMACGLSRCDSLPCTHATSSATSCLIWSQSCGDDSLSGMAAAGADFARDVKDGGPLQSRVEIA